MIDAELVQPAVAAPDEEGRSEDTIASAMERHLTRYFCEFRRRPAAARASITASCARWSTRCCPRRWPQRAATRSAPPTCSGVNRNTLRKKIRDLDIQVIRTSG